MTVDNFCDVYAFHAKFELPRAVASFAMRQDELDFRTKFLYEELEEFNDARAQDNLVSAIDSLLDLNYVAIGTALFIGVSRAWPDFASTIRSNRGFASIYAENDPQFMHAKTHRFFGNSMWSKIEGFEIAHEAAVDNEPGALGLTLEILRGISSTCYIAAAYMGAPWEQCWTHVQNANMAKIRAARDGSDSKRGSGFDVIKPAGWKAPDEGIAYALQRRGWTMPPHLTITDGGKVVVA